MAYEPKEPSTLSNVANTTAETVKGAGLGLALTAAVLIGAPILTFTFGSFIAGLAVTAISALVAGPVLFGSAAGIGAIFGARRGFRQNDQESAKAQGYEQGKAILTAQEAQLAQAQSNYTQPVAAPAYVMASANNNCPNCRVSNMNYQGQLAATNMQQGLAG